MEYIGDFFEYELPDQYMWVERNNGKIRKRIGLTLVDLSKRAVIRARDMFSREAARLFTPKLYAVEKFKVSCKAFLSSVFLSFSGLYTKFLARAWVEK